jgi:hypothetical protein
MSRRKHEAGYGLGNAEIGQQKSTRPDVIDERDRRKW